MSMCLGFSWEPERRVRVRPGKQGCPVLNTEFGTSYSYTEVAWDTGQGAGVGVSVSSNKDLKPCYSILFYI